MHGRAEPGIDQNECVRRTHEQAVVRAVRRSRLGGQLPLELARIDIVEEELDYRRAAAVTKQPAFVKTRLKADLLHWIRPR